MGINSVRWFQPLPFKIHFKRSVGISYLDIYLKEIATFNVGVCALKWSICIDSIPVVA